MISPVITSAFFDWADRHDIAVALDTGWPMAGWTAANCTATRAWPFALRSGAFNEVETVTLAGLESPVDAAREIRFSMKKGATVVVKRGPDGALAIGPERRLRRGGRAACESRRHDRRRRCLQRCLSRRTGAGPTAESLPVGRHAGGIPCDLHLAPQLWRAHAIRGRRP